MSLEYLPTFIYSQLLVTPPAPTRDFTNQVVIVTGANSGLGFEAAKAITRLNAQKVILAVRNASKGEAARADIEQSTGRKGVVEVWNLDLLNYASIRAFAQQAQELPRLDVVIENAGISTRQFRFAEGHERTIVTHVHSTFLLALLLLPKLRESGRKFNTTPRLSIVSSEVHYFTQLPEKSSPSIFEALRDPHTADMGQRYFVSKLVQVLYFRHLAQAISQSAEHPVTLNIMNPGLCVSNINGQDEPVPFVVKILKALLSRRTDIGARTIVASACASPDTHGEYMSDGVIAPYAKWVTSEEGKMTEQRVWDELNAILEDVEPGVTRNI